MWVNHVILALMGLFAGFAVSAGTFAFLIAIGLIPRLIGKSNTARSVFTYETMILLGGIAGNVVSTYADCSISWGRILLIVFGFCAGIFVGCIAVSLAEIINTFPIVFRRYKLSIGLAWALAFMAFGKLAGSLFYFWTGYMSTL